MYEGRSNRGLGRLPHRVIFTVTDLTKKVNGVRTVVLWDRDINAGKLLEGELALWAQDDDGNVWLLGEYPEEYDEQGRFEQAPDTWIAGLERAEAGIMMRADPKEGTSRYHQGLAPAIGFADVARVEKTGEHDCVPTGCYDDVVVTRETNPDEPADGFQLKYYAPGVGNTRAAPRGGKEKEILVLIKTRKLGAREMDEVRREARKLDTRAYRSQKDLWGQTPPVEQALAVILGPEQGQALLNRVAFGGAFRLGSRQAAGGSGLGRLRQAVAGRPRGRDVFEATQDARQGLGHCYARSGGRACGAAVRRLRGL